MVAPAHLAALLAGAVGLVREEPMTHNAEKGARLHVIAGATLPPQGAGQTVPELMILCWTCGWMRAGEYDAHIAERAWDEGYEARRSEGRDGPGESNPHRPVPPAGCSPTCAPHLVQFCSPECEERWDS